MADLIVMWIVYVLAMIGAMCLLTTAVLSLWILVGALQWRREQRRYHQQVMSDEILPFPKRQ